MDETKLEQIKKTQTYVRMLMPILSDLLSGVEKISNSMHNLEYALPALDLIDEIIDMMNDCLLHEFEEVIEGLKEAVEKFNQFYIKMSETYHKLD